MGKSTMNGLRLIAMLLYRRVAAGKDSVGLTAHRSHLVVKTCFFGE